MLMFCVFILSSNRESQQKMNQHLEKDCDYHKETTKMNFSIRYYSDYAINLIVMDCLDSGILERVHLYARVSCYDKKLRIRSQYSPTIPPLLSPVIMINTVLLSNLRREN